MVQFVGESKKAREFEKCRQFDRQYLIGICDLQWSKKTCIKLSEQENVRFKIIESEINKRYDQYYC